MLLVGAVLVAGVPAETAGSVPGATAYRACAGAGAYWPTMTLALNGTSAWVACKEQGRVIRLDTRTSRIRARISLPGSVIAVASGYGSVWALDSSTLYRINPSTARVTKRIALGASAPYNIWIGGGSVWVADDQGARVIRVAPATGRVVRRVAVGDGPREGRRPRPAC